MSATSLLYNILVLCSAILALGLTGYAIRRDNAPASRTFALLMLAIAEWSFSYVFANFAPDPSIRLFWLAAADIGIAFCGPLWLLFALANTGQIELLPRSVRVGIWLLGALSLAALTTNGAIAILNYGVSAVVHRNAALHGPFFWLHTLIAYSAILAGLAVMARTSLIARSPYREQAQLILIGALIPLLVNVAYLAGLFDRSNTADVTPIALAISSLLFSYALRRHQMLTLSPIARQVMLDSMIDGLLVVDLAGRIVEHNPAATTIAQLAPGAVGRLLTEASSNRTLGNALHRLFTAATADEQIVAVPTPQPHYIHVTRTSLNDTASRRLGTLLMLRDITRQTLAEEALARQAADLTTLHHVASAIGTTIEPRELLPAIVGKTREALGMSYAAVGLIEATSGDLLMTAESDDDNGISLVGERFTLDDGVFAEAERTGAPIIITDPQHDPRLVTLHNQLTCHQIQSVLIIPLRANDHLIGALNFANTTPYSFDREKLHLVQMIAGYVAAAIANAQLFEAAQQAVRTKSAILDTISHEFRTPITAILGFTELYQEHVLGPVTDEQHEALSAVHRNAHRLLKLVDDMLDLARLESGKLDLALHPVEIELCIKEAAAIVEMQSSGKPFQLQIDVSANLPFAQADAMWLRRALGHLLSHALSSSPTRRIAIHAHTGAQHEGSTVGGPQLLIDIEDHELELSEAEQAAMFEAFQLIPNSASELTISSISRMGLAISKRAIEQMSGQLSLHSQPGQGSTFTIRLRAVELALEHVH
jgi:signal transduction histidine kinase/PAS domain-containing protein